MKMKIFLNLQHLIKEPPHPCSAKEIDKEGTEG